MDKLKDKINYSRIESLKKKFWKEHTLLFNEYPEAMELMRAIGVEQGKVQAYKEAQEILDEREKEILRIIKEKWVDAGIILPFRFEELKQALKGDKNE